jgi:hypothetical protein
VIDGMGLEVTLLAGRVAAHLASDPGGQSSM